MEESRRKQIRENSAMSLFSLYIDDITKLEVLKKLRTLGIDTKKGSLSALIRVLLNEFAEQENPLIDAYIAEKVQEEYLFTTKKNKRSTL